MKKAFQIGFILVVFLLILFPFVLMPFFHNDTNSEKRELSSMPSIINSEGSFNVNFMSEFGNYFEEHFAFRTELIAFNNSLNRTLLTSGSDSVIVGNDGWLFYSGSKNDYERKDQLSDRALQNIAHNLSLLQRYCESQGSKFVFVCPPNKNELYSNKMPYYYIKGEGESNWKRLVQYLDEYNVNYVDLYSLLKSDSETLYLKTDSHWNTKGAYLATNAILENLQIESGNTSVNLVSASNLTGDLESLINPLNPTKEEDFYIQGINDGEGFKGTSWSFKNGTAVEDSTVETNSEGKSAYGSLLMYRDSFANALIPLFSSKFNYAYYSKLVPYNTLLIQDQKPGVVVVERAQRHLSYLAEVAPIMSSTLVEKSLETKEEKNLDVGLKCSKNGPFTILQGTVPKSYQSSDVKIYMSIIKADGTSQTYEAFNCSQNLPESFVDSDGSSQQSTTLNGGIETDYGFTFYFDSEALGDKNCEFSLCVENGNQASCIKTFEYSSLNF